MKLSSLSVILLLSALTSAAEVVMVSGTVYDVGKGYWSTDSDVTNTADSQLCWAATASNLIQHWQDVYGVAEGAPNGYSETAYTMPSGTQYLKIYDLFCANFTNDGGNLQNAVNWYFNGKSVSNLKTDEESGGYYSGKGISTTSVTGFQVPRTLAQLQNTLATPFKKEGYAVFLSISPVSGGTGHAITCWGYETDEKGSLCALYITDSDDMKFGAQRLEVTVKNSQILLSSSYENSSYSSSTYALTGIYYLNSSTYNADKSSNALEKLPESGVVRTAVDISGKQLSSNSKLTLAAGSIFAASGGTGTSLTLDGAGSADSDGLEVQAGSMVSLSQADVGVSRFSGNGMSVGSEVHIAKGNVSVQNNGGIGIAVQGNADDPKAYMSLSGNSSVDVSYNKKGGLLVGDGALALSSGGYYPAGDQLDITGNTSVVISHNEAENGGGALVNSVLNLTGNGTLNITDNTAKNGAAIYAKTKAVTTTGNYCAVTYASVDIDDNEQVNIKGNTATDSDIVYFRGKQMSISDNTTVEISGNKVNSTSNTSAVLHNSADRIYVSSSSSYLTSVDPSVMEIAHNGSVTFAGNTAKYDIYNEGSLYVCADKGQSVTFQHGIANSSTGTTYIGCDASDQKSTGGTYIFADGAKAVVMETTTATISAGGSITWTTGEAGDWLVVNSAELNAATTFSLSGCGLLLNNVTVADTLTVDCGYYLDKNKLQLDKAVDTLAITIHLDSVAAMATFGSSELTETTVILSDYLTLGAGASVSTITFTLDGALADGQLLVVDTNGVSISDSNVIATAYTMDRNESGMLLYTAKSTEYTPEPTTTTLSLLALAALAARRRRRFALPTNH